MATTVCPANAVPDRRPVFFFDIDNCVCISDYDSIVDLLDWGFISSKTDLLIFGVRSSILEVRTPADSSDSTTTDKTCADCNIHDEMQKLINQFFVKHLSLSSENAHMLHQKYYKEYGLALEGLTRHHTINPLRFNCEVDDALPLDKILKPAPELRKFLEDIDTSKVKPWLLTNAYITHARRVVKLLGVDDLFEGITYCDYAHPPLVCKPSQDMYEKAEIEAQALSTEECYFVDDSYLNCKHAAERGWTTVHLVEPMLPVPPVPASQYMIRSLEELRKLFPQLFKSTAAK
ncbi:putative pyrimidine 5'-nucleotidase [Aspergillus clavatus NRRL 1]|uniref:Pyrimidine 5'-nucleotidase, putative n=1 Tax=Aspergillus clavatus (strain ATCC 1007 / CBS 513.65 / DSM 816 / NCTC 3887 / NRRL 1 / QM 1276 / 107) TaxID=344612 RepID=A1C724_ASPCL|nr:pyrimidine 5'-nucleotidase, putative [Aspergillus clavatus NRRL 1]EAW14195.1 pyrimidine 5'-nucleotidase, putative [Aspergillus clavatus NRRL 1]